MVDEQDTQLKSPWSKAIELRPLQDGDIALMRAWLAKDHVRRWYHDPDEWLREISERHGEFAFLRHFIVLFDAVPIGFCQYYACADIDEEEYRAFPKAGTYSIDYLLGEEAFIGRKLGKAIVRKLSEMIFANPEARIIVVQPEKENLASCATLCSCGFIYDTASGVYIKSRQLRSIEA